MEEFTATAYPNVQENLKLTVDEPVIPEGPASSTGNLYSLQHLAKDFGFGNQFFDDKPSRKAIMRRTTAEPLALLGRLNHHLLLHLYPTIRVSWWKPLTEDRHVTPEPAWSIPSSDLTVPMNNWASALKSTYTPPPVNSTTAQTFISSSKWKNDTNFSLIKWTMQSSVRSQDGQGLLVNLDVEGCLDILMTALEQWYRIRSGLKKDAVKSLRVCISHCGFKDMVYIVRTPHMKKIVLRQADLKEYVIAERDFKYLYPSDFEDMYLLNLQGHLNHLSPKDKKILTTAVNLWTRNLVIRQRVEDLQLGIESYQTPLNLTKPRWDAKGFEYKHDFTVIDSPRAVTFRDKYGVQMIMRFNEIHKFSDGTLQQIDEALDYRVKEFRVNRMNPGLDTRFWTKKDVDRSKDFMFAIQKRLKTRRIFQNLESFVGGRIREGDYRLLKRTE
ncbi:hypothetical protein Tco_0472028 [Tanacetum coccineum]